MLKEYCDDCGGFVDSPHECESADLSESALNDLLCNWTRAFDQHFNISCESGERANGNFKGKDKGATWEFKYCPYCGREINEIVA